MVPLSPEFRTQTPELFAREQWDEAVDFHIASAEATGRGDLSVVFIDLNFFKLVNDNIGYETGDRVLEDFGDLLINVTNKLRIHPRSGDRNADVVALDEMIDTQSGRWGGDEYSVLAHTDKKGTEKLIERVRGAFTDYIELPEHRRLKELGVGISVGAAFYEPGKTREDLVREASESMKQDKESQLPELTPEEELVKNAILNQLDSVDRPDILLRHIAKR